MNFWFEARMLLCFRVQAQQPEGKVVKWKAIRDHFWSMTVKSQGEWQVEVTKTLDCM